jgi:DNA polymerase phi
MSTSSICLTSQSGSLKLIREESALNARRSWIIDQTSALVRNGAVPKADTWTTEVLDFLTLYGLFVVKKKSEKSTLAPVRVPAKPAFTKELQSSCRIKLLGCLADLTVATTTVKAEDGKAAKSTGTAADGSFWVSKVLESIRRFEDESKHISPVTDMDEEETALRAKAKETLSSLKTVSIAHPGDSLILIFVVGSRGTAVRGSGC